MDFMCVQKSESLRQAYRGNTVLTQTKFLEPIRLYKNRFNRINNQIRIINDHIVRVFDVIKVSSHGKLNAIFVNILNK